MGYDKKAASDKAIHQRRKRNKRGPDCKVTQELSMEVSHNVFNGAKKAIEPRSTERLLSGSISCAGDTGPSPVSQFYSEGSGRGHGHEPDKRPARNRNVASGQGSADEGQGVCPTIQDEQSGGLGLDSGKAQSGNARSGLDRWQEIVSEQMGAGPSHVDHVTAEVLSQLAILIPQRDFLADLTLALTNYPSMPVLPLTRVGVAALAAHIFDTLALQGWLLPEYVDGSVLALHTSDAVELVDAAVRGTFCD